MNELDLVVKTAKKIKKTKAETEHFLNALVDVIQDTLANDETIYLKDFGTFSTCTRAARKGKDPKTKKAITIPACKTVRFIIGEGLKDEINKGL